MSTSQLAPIALFVYRRPFHTQIALQALSRCVSAPESELFIFCDGAKGEADLARVQEVRSLIRQKQWCGNVQLIERETNIGLANSIIDGVTNLCNKYGRVIVLEDDLVVAPHFLDYMNRALSRYENELQVMQVSGYMFPVKLQIEEDGLFLPLTTSWGWATWQRAWQSFDPAAKGHSLLAADLSLRNRFNLDGTYDYFSMLEAQFAGRVDSWAIRWYLSTFLRDGLTLYPRETLVLNIGFDGSGTHGNASAPSSCTEMASGFRPMLFPDSIAISTSWDRVRRGLLESQHPLDRIKAWLKRVVLGTIVGSSRVDLQACKLEYSIVSPK